MRPGFPLLLAFWGFIFPFPLLVAQPVANFTADTLSGCDPNGLLVNFQDLSTGNPNSWQWDLGGNSSTNQNPSIIFNGAGCYDVTLIVTNALGADTLTQTCFIEIFPQPAPLFGVSQSNGCAPLDVTFFDQSTPNATSIVSWIWTLSNGMSSTLQNPTFTFSIPDTISATLLVVNSNGCQNLITISNVVAILDGPVAGFNSNVNAACATPVTAFFTNTSQSNGALLPTYQWIFVGGTLPGGGNTSNQFTPPPVSYNSTGNFPVTLIISSANGCTDTLTQNNFINIGGVVANFTADTTTVCAGDPINFTSTSTGGVTSLQWNFGEAPGIDATGPNVTYTYTTPGTYSVTLGAVNAQCGDTITKFNFITVNPDPIADYGVDRNQDCQPGNPFQFADSSQNYISIVWDFGDGTPPVSGVQNPSHTYSALGTFSACVTVTNVFGCDDTHCENITISAPQATFTATPTQGCIPVNVQFADNSTSLDSIVSWAWDFGTLSAIPSTSTLQNPTTTFTAQGTFLVQLIVTTANGCVDTAQTGMTFGNPPFVNFTADKDTVCINEVITFTSDSTDPDWNYFWDFQYTAPGSFAMLDSMPSTTYPDSGLFSVALIIENMGCRDTLIKTDFVYVSPPKAIFIMDPTILCQLPGFVTLTDSSIGPADIYDWKLDGVSFSSSQTPPAVPINSIGTYTIRLIVTNSATGCVDSTDQMINAGNPIADFSTPDIQGCRPYTSTFVNTSMNASFYNWVFDYPGGGVTSGFQPSTTYADTGSYSVLMIAIDIFGCQDTMIRPNYIRVLGPYAGFEADDLADCPGVVINFTDTSSTAIPGVINSWLWDFGDPPSGGNNTSALQNPSHTYANPGLYTVTLTVGDDQGCSDTQTTTGYISVTFPVPDFMVDDSSTCAGNVLNFSSTSVGTGLSYFWDFGDSVLASGANPPHAYSDTGSYDVQLITVDVNGCTDSITKPAFIYIEPFYANFGADPTTGICPPLVTSFTDSSVGNVVTWFWDFGTGIDFSNNQNPSNVYLTPGSFDVMQVVTHEDGCQDTLLRLGYINIGGPTGTFNFTPENACLGDTSCIEAIVNGATTITFDFRDGTTYTQTGFSGSTDTATQCHLYVNPGQYTPVLILSDANGCLFTPPSTDTTTIFQLPSANFNPTDTITCDPATITFLDLSVAGDTGLASWLWDFGDSTALDTIPNPIHTFFDAGLFSVTLVVTDSNGCSDSVTHGIFDIEGAFVPNFIANDSIGCPGQLFQFTDLTSKTVPANWLWDFGDNTTILGVQNPTHTYSANGLYTVTLIVTDSFGCLDTLIKPNYIFIREPVAVLYADSTLGCNPLILTFFGDSSQTDTSFLQYEWCFTNKATGLTSCQTTSVDSLQFTFQNAGDFGVTLTVTDFFGCTALSNTVDVTVIQTTTPPPLRTQHVSVLSDTSARIQYDRYSGTDFKHYLVTRLNGPNPGVIARITDIDSTQFIEGSSALDFSANSYCYKILVVNTCGVSSRPSETQLHCSIELQTTPAVNSINLNWSAYTGFGVAAYDVYRVADYDTSNVQLIATVPGIQTDYLDLETNCTDSISYRILALGVGGGGQRSYSDISSDAALHPKPVEFSDVRTASVINDLVIDLSWETYTGYKPAGYYLQRSLDGTVWDTLATSIPLSQTTYTDADVEVDERSYYYRVFALDECGDTSATGNLGRSILLKLNLDLTGRRPLLNWSAYQEWDNGVLAYEIEFFDSGTGNFVLVDKINGRNQSYVDKITPPDKGEFCYRVRAIENGNNAASALSNVDCVLMGPAVFVPSAFTPNGDGKNDTFYFLTPNAAEIEFKVFDRWGELVFTTMEIGGEWDGVYKGRPSPEGVYVYRLTGTGVNGTTFDKSGTITLIR